MTQNQQDFCYIPLFLAIPVYLIYIILSTKIFCISGIYIRCNLDNCPSPIDLELQIELEIL